MVTWSWQTSEEFFVGFSTQSLLALVLGSRNDLCGVYRDAGELQSQKAILWAIYLFQGHSHIFPPFPDIHIKLP